METDYQPPVTCDRDSDFVLWLGARIQLGHNTQVSRLFWLMALKPQKPISFDDIRATVDGAESGRRHDSNFDAVELAKQRARKALSKLRERLRRAGLADRCAIARVGAQSAPSYMLVLG